MERSMIIKALECCANGNCYIGAGCPLIEGDEYDDDISKCTSELSKYALALIKELAEANAIQIVTAIELDKQVERLTEEWENYKRIAEYQQNCNMDRGFKIKRLTEENERLKAEVSVKKKLLDKCVDLEDRVKDDTVKRFAEKLEITLMSRLVTATKEQKAAILFCINQINQTKAIMTKPKDCLQCKHFVGCEPSTLGGCDLYEEEEKK